MPPIGFTKLWETQTAIRALNLGERTSESNPFSLKKITNYGSELAAFLRGKASDAPIEITSTVATTASAISVEIV